MNLSRRSFCSWLSALAAYSLSGELSALAALQKGSRLGPPEPFDFEVLRARAENLARTPFQHRAAPERELIQAIDFDAVQEIAYKPERSLWKGRAHPLRLFHLHRYTPLPVKINLITSEGARRVTYSASDFAYGDRRLEQALPDNLGYAGFRIMDAPGAETDWLAFAGASYFRSSGEDRQYGASARGIAIDTALTKPEEFPAFVEFWLEPGAGPGESVRIYALLDGPSVTGAYEILARKETTVVMEVTAELYFREGVERLGIAPLTSMYWYGENDRRMATDWRPEIHDSDGLALATGSGERIWRPLINPSDVRVNSFYDENPRGFGLMQRDRDFSNYQDDGAFYNRRPGIWVEPLSDWGKGAVTLVEIPTDDEIYDNIGAFWTPAKAINPGDRRRYSYRLHWRNEEPFPPQQLARVVATRIGDGGVPGQGAQGERNKRKFVIDFRGGALEEMEARFDIEPVISTSSGRPENPYVIKVVGTDRWRAVFDLPVGTQEAIDLRCFLRLGEETLTETWLYQYLPKPESEKS